MKNKKVLIGIIIAVAIIVIVGIAVYTTMQNNKKQLEILNEEAKKLSEMDLLNDNIDMEIKTSGKYAIVEKTMKEYLNDTKQTMNELVELCNNSDLDNILSSDNISKDAPDFVGTKEKLSSFKIQINEYIEKCDNLLNKENIENAINDKGVDDYYKQLYKTLMFDEETATDLEETRKELKESAEEVNEVIEGLEKVINFLVENKTEWKVSDGKIQFNNLTKLKEYYNILSEI